MCIYIYICFIRGVSPRRGERGACDRLFPVIDNYYIISLFIFISISIMIIIICKQRKRKKKK